MKILLLLVSALICLALGAFIYLGFQSQSGNANGIVAGKLSKCPDSPNCVCSEFESDAGHFIEPLKYSDAEASVVLSDLKSILLSMGGKIETESENYLAASFRSSIFRFVDDLEIRIEAECQLIHLRSASRVGRGDGGVNRLRLETLKNLYRGRSRS